jgi:Fic family protein
MDFFKSPAGRVLKLPQGYKAFLPNDLPPQFDWDIRLIHALSRADFLVGQLAREGKDLNNPHLLMRPFLVREAVLSSMIEGTQTTLAEAFAAEVGATPKTTPADLLEVQNYIQALNHGLLRLEKLPLSLRLIREIHEKLMLNVRGGEATPGEFRRSQNWIGSPGCTLNTAKFVPPPADNLMDCLGKFELFLHDRQLPPLVQIALCHYQFEAIHPFLDGNGRVGRLLIALMLAERNLLASPLLYLSGFFEATRPEYYRQLYSVSKNGTWNDWLLYFLNGVAHQSEDSLSRIERINGLLNRWKAQLKKGNVRVVLDTIRLLANNPYVSINSVAKELGIAYTTAQRAISRMEKLGFISPTSKSKRDRIYCAKELLAILEEPLKLITYEK